LKTCCCVSAQKKSPRNKVVPRNPVSDVLEIYSTFHFYLCF
jgi:hypothetical protein